METVQEKIECKHQLTRWLKSEKECDFALDTLIKYKAPYEIKRSGNRFAVYVSE